MSLDLSQQDAQSRNLSPFQRPFSRWTWVSRYQNVSILDFIGTKDGGGGGDNWSYETCKAPGKMSPPTNQHPVLLQIRCPSSTGKLLICKRTGRWFADLTAIFTGETNSVKALKEQRRKIKVSNRANPRSHGTYGNVCVCGGIHVCMRLTRATAPLSKHCLNTRKSCRVSVMVTCKFC